MELSARMLSCYPKESNLETDFKLLQTQTPDAAAAFLRVVEFARNVFGLKPYVEDEQGNASGVTGGEALSVLGQFNQYIETVKKNIVTPPTSPASTAPASSNGEANPTTNSSSASGSTATAASTAAASAPSSAPPAS